VTGRASAAIVAVAALAAAAGLGVAAGVAPVLTAAAVAAMVSAVVLLPRLEWAALALVCAAVFADWLALLSAHATAWLTALLLLAWAVRRAAGPIHARCPAWVLLPSGVLTAVLALTAAAQWQGVGSLRTTASYAVPLAVFVVLVDCLCGPLAPRRAARAYVVSCVLAAVAALAAAALTPTHRLSGPLDRPDELALFLLAAVPLAPTLARRPTLTPRTWAPSRRREVVLVSAVVTVLVAALLGTRSRAALIALLVVVGVAVVTRTLSLPQGGAFAAVVGAGAVFVLVAGPYLSGGLTAGLGPDRDPGLVARVECWHEAVRATAQSPLLGSGAGSGVGNWTDSWTDSWTGSWTGSRPDGCSTVLQASRDLGVVGAAALVAVVVVPLAGARCRWRRDRSRLTAAVCLALSGLLVLSLVQTAQFVLPLWLLAALAAALGRRNRGRLGVPDAPAAAVAGGVAHLGGADGRP